MRCFNVREKSYEGEGLFGSQNLVFLRAIVTASAVSSCVVASPDALDFSEVPKTLFGFTLSPAGRS